MLDTQFLSIDEDIDMQENEMEFGNKVLPEVSAGEGGFPRIFNNLFTRIWLFLSHSHPALGQEHNVFELLSSVDVWLYLFTYFCGETLGLFYNNNLGKISQSRGNSNATVFVSIYSSFSFFGGLLSAALEYIPRYSLSYIL